MSALRKLFGPDRHSFPCEVADLEQHATFPHPFPPDIQPSQRRSRRNQSFLKFEKQSEAQHDQLRSRPSTKRSKRISHMLSAGTNRHVDVLEAYYCQQKPHTIPKTMGSTGLYNEDIAERNLVAGKHGSKAAVNRYLQVISALYQEDVADRNMVSSSPPILVSPPPVDATVQKNNKQYNKRLSRPESCSEKTFDENSALRTIASDQDLRKRPGCLNSSKSSSRREPSQDSEANGALRSRKSAPALSVQFIGEKEENAIPVFPINDGPGRNKMASGVVLPDRKSSCRPLRQSTSRKHQGAPKERAEQQNGPVSDSQSCLLSPSSAKRGSRRNVRDLSINTTLAAPQKTFARISNRPSVVSIAAPSGKDSHASLDEIVNSPISLATPISPSPAMTSFSAADMMNLFKQAYESSQKSSTSNPTFETLQDAIIREINNHDAFSHIKPPSSGLISPIPPLTPEFRPDSKHAHERGSRPTTAISRSKSFVSRDEGNMQMQKQGCEQNQKSVSQRRELSFPAIKGLESKAEDTPARRRRHTYSQCALGTRVRISEPADTPSLPTRSATKKRPKSSASAVGQLPKSDLLKGFYNKRSSIRQQATPQSLISRAATILKDSTYTLRQSHSEQSLRTLVNNEDRSTISSQEVTYVNDYDGNGRKGNPSISIKNAMLPSFISPRKPTRPKHIPIVISDSTTNNVTVNSYTANPKKNYNIPPVPIGKKRGPFRIVSS